MSDALRTRERKTFADYAGLPTGIYGERYEGVLICEENRATVFEYRPDGIQQLIDYKNQNYRRKGINACVFGVDDGVTIKYAVFVKSGFLRDVSEDEDLVPRKRTKKNGRQTRQRI